VSENTDFNRVSVLVVGGGPSGLATAIQLKVLKPQVDVCVIDKALDPGNHNLSGAVLEAEPLHSLLDAAAPDWRDTDTAKDVLANVIDKDDIMFLLGKNMAFNIISMIKLSRKMGLGVGQMIHEGDYSVSISKLTKWMTQIAKDVGAEVLNGFAAQDILYDAASGKAAGVKLVDQGLDKEGHEQPNYLEGEVIEADFVVLSEGCDGLVAEKFIEASGLKRKCPQLYSVGVKELIKVRPDQYEKFGAGRVVHAMGYPIWTPVMGPGMFGGGIVYAGAKDHLSVGMIVGADWKYCDFNTQDALTLFKEHKFVKQFIEDGEVVEAGAKMIPEGGYYAIPRDPDTNAIGKGNVMLLGDSAGFVNMNKIKGLHNGIDSGVQAAKAIVDNLDSPEKTAVQYTELIEKSNVMKEMYSARNFRQTVAKFGPLQGMPLSCLAGLLPAFEVESDYEAMTVSTYRLKPHQNFDKDTFTAVAATEHREEEPCHLNIVDPQVCMDKCQGEFNSPCIAFCPAGVYETIGDEVKAANPSNCLHCKTCQRKCPFDNIRWTVPEGGGGPRYKRM